MRVAQSPDFLQSVIDHPEVSYWIKPDGHEGIDLSRVFSDGIGFEFETGGFFFHRLGDGIYEVHTLFLPGSTGAFAACRAVAHYMFCATECTKIVTKVPEDNIPAWKLTEKMKFTRGHTQEKAYTRGGQLHDVRHYSLHMDDWGRDQPLWVKGQCEAFGNVSKGDRFLLRYAVMNADKTVLES